MSKKKNRRKRKNKSKSNLYKGPGSKGRAETPDGKPVKPEPQFTKGMRKVAQTVFNRLLPPLRETTEVLEMIAEEGGKSAKDAEAFAGILKDFNHRIENHMIANGMAQPAGNARPQPVQQESTEESAAESAADKPKRTITPVDGSDDDEWECWVEAGDEQTLAGIADSLEDARAWVKGDDSVLDEEEGDEDDPDPDEDGADEAEEPAEKTQEAKSKAKPKKK